MQGKFNQASRRRFVGGSLAATAAAWASSSAAQATPPGSVKREVPPDPSKVPGVPMGQDGGYGTRSQFETEVRVRYDKTSTDQSSWTFTPLAQGHGIITPSGLHFERSHAGTPVTIRRGTSCSCMAWCDSRASLRWRSCGATRRCHASCSSSARATR